VAKATKTNLVAKFTLAEDAKAKVA
jgi:hypothetical protein